MDNADVDEREALQEPHVKSKSKGGSRLTLFAAWSAAFVALSGTWQYGFSIGSINAIYLTMRSVIREQYQHRWNTTVSDDVVDAVWVISSAAFPVGGIFGSLLVGPITKKFGRLNGMFLGHICTISFTLLLSLSEVFRSPEVIILARFGIGITAGAIGTGISVMYTVEVSPQQYRGAFGSLISLGIALSILSSNILGLPQLLGNERLWPLLFAFTALPSVIFVLSKRTLAHSPRQLYMEDGKEEKAIKTLKKLHAIDDVTHLINDMQKEAKDAMSNKQMTVKELIASKSMRRPLLAAFVLTSAQQLSGLNGVAFNMNRIYSKSGIDEQYVYYVSIGTSAMICTIAIFSALIIERCGRKFLLVLGYSIIGMSLLLLAISMETQNLNSNMAYVAVASSLGFWIGFALGPGPVTLLVVGEFFEQSARSAAVTLSVTFLWIGFVTTVVVTPYLLEAIGGYTFLPYSIFATGTAVFIYVCVPETKNLAFRQIRESFRHRQKGQSNRRLVQKERKDSISKEIAL